MVFIAEAHQGKLSPITIGMVLAASGAGGAIGSAAASRLFASFSYYLLPMQMGIWVGTLGFLAWQGVRSYPCLAVAMAAALKLSESPFKRARSSQEPGVDREHAAYRLVPAKGFLRLVAALLGPAYLVDDRERRLARRQS
jgi:hypothetical protein